MFKTEINLRVRYAETDRMGYVYYGNFATYFEVARVECLRKLNITYKSLEDSGILMPVSEYHVNYLHPAYYDDDLRIVTCIPELPGAKILFHYDIYNQNNQHICKASTTLFFYNSEKSRPVKVPEHIVNRLKDYF